MDEPALHDDLEPLRGYVGIWRGEGTGRYPTIEPFAYGEEVRFWHNGKPFLGYQQRTWHPTTAAPMHAESGYWRPIGLVAGDGALTLEAVISHPTGVSEIQAGAATDGKVRVESTTVARTPTAKEVTTVVRTIEVVGDELTYEVHMAAVGQPLQFHLAATLHRTA